MKSNLSVDSIKNNWIKKYKSLNNIQTKSNKKSSTTKNINNNKNIYFLFAIINQILFYFAKYVHSTYVLYVKKAY